MFQQIEMAIGGRLAIASVMEDESYYLDELSLDQREQQQLEALRGHKRLEWLASRCLIKRLIGGRQWPVVCLKDEYGKPYIEGNNVQLSISHSRERVAAMLADGDIGVDIQQFVPKIARIAHKFISSTEMDFVQAGDDPLALMHLIWGAKECLYKAYGRRKLSFNEHMRIFPATYAEQGRTGAFVRYGDYHKFFAVHWKQIDNYLLVYCYETESEDGKSS